jgi:hypothetical protein
MQQHCLVPPQEKKSNIEYFCSIQEQLCTSCKDLRHSEEIIGSRCRCFISVMIEIKIHYTNSKAGVDLKPVSSKSSLVEVAPESALPENEERLADGISADAAPPPPVSRHIFYIIYYHGLINRRKETALADDYEWDFPVQPSKKAKNMAENMVLRRKTACHLSTG